MKKYLIKLVANDINQDNKDLIFCLSILVRMPDDEYWLRRKQSLENRINKNKSYLKCLSEMDIKASTTKK